MNYLTTMLLALAALGPCFLPTTVAAPATAAPSVRDARIADFDWIRGCWRRTSRGQVLEESWGEPLGNGMTGNFRWLRRGVGWVYEFLLIEKTEEGITFYLRHFGKGSRAHEPVDKPIDFPLKSVRKNEAIFEHPTRDTMKRLIYRRAGDRLTVRVEGIGKDGKVKADVFEFVAYRGTPKTPKKLR